MADRLKITQYIFSYVFMIFFNIIIAPRLHIAGAHSNMALILTVWIGLTRGPRTGMIFGLGAGLLTGVLTPIELGWVALLLSAAGLIVGNVKGKLSVDPLPLKIITLLIVALAYNVAFLFFTRFGLLYVNPSFIFFDTIGSAFYTTVIGAIVFYAIKYRHILGNLF